MISQNSVGYYGFAEVSFYRGKDKVKTIKIKNNGTNLLFRCLSQAVCGLSVGAYMPKYFDMGMYDSEFKSVLSNRAVLTARLVENVSLNENDVASVAAKFTATIPSRTVSDKESTINCLRLYNEYSSSSREENSLLAQIDLQESEVVSVDNEQYSIMVEWIMTFGNVIKSGEEA